jgi:hypothetical protein
VSWWKRLVLKPGSPEDEAAGILAEETEGEAVSVLVVKAV